MFLGEWYEIQGESEKVLKMALIEIKVFLIYFKRKSPFLQKLSFCLLIGYSLFLKVHLLDVSFP